MITLHDIVHLPTLEPWLEQIAREPHGLVVVAGLGGDGPTGVLGILCRQMLATSRPGGQPRRALAIGAQARFVRPARSQEAQVRYLRTTGRKALTYAEALAQAEAQGADLVILDELNARNLADALRLAEGGRAVVAPLDTLLVGGQVLRHLGELGASEVLLAHVGWILSVQRLAALCRHCREAWHPTPEERLALGLGPGEATEVGFFRNRGCPECAGDVPPRFFTAFDVFRHRPQNGSPARQARRPSDLSLRAYALGLAEQAHIPLDEVRDLDLNVLQRAQAVLLARQRELAQAEAELRAKVATLEASHRVLLSSTQALISLQDVTQTLAASTDLDDLAGRILHYARQTMGADLVALYLIEPDGCLRIAALSGWNPAALGRRLPAAEVEPWLSRAAQGQALALEGDEWPPGVASLPLDREGPRGGLLLALTAHRQPVGLLFAHSTLKRQFRPSEKGVLQMFADQAAVAIQRARLIADLQAKIGDLEWAQVEIVKKERMEHELQLARELQESILPADFPRRPGVQLAAHSVPARAVGGDFYDVFELPGQRLGLVIADVSDKGLPAALFMALTRSLVRAEARRESSPAQVLANVNRLLLEISTSAMFVTAFYGVLHLGRGELVYARAGHERPLHYRAADRSCRPLPGGGVVLGILPSISLEEQVMTLEPGDEVLLFTDGVTDAPLPSGQAYGHERLARALEAHYDLDVEGQCRALFAELAALHEGAEAFDDAAALLLRYEPARPAVGRLS